MLAEIRVATRFTVHQLNVILVILMESIHKTVSGNNVKHLRAEDMKQLFTQIRFTVNQLEFGFKQMMQMKEYKQTFEMNANCNHCYCKQVNDSSVGQNPIIRCFIKTLTHMQSVCKQTIQQKNDLQKMLHQIEDNLNEMQQHLEQQVAYDRAVSQRESKVSCLEADKNSLLIQSLKERDNSMKQIGYKNNIEQKRCRQTTMKLFIDSKNPNKRLEEESSLNEDKIVMILTDSKKNCSIFKIFICIKDDPKCKEIFN